MPDIDDRWVDVDFPSDPHFVLGDLGPGTLFADCGDYEATFGALSDAQIRDCIEAMDAAGGGLDRLVSRIYNQRNEGSCVANACSQAHELAQAKAFGIERVVHLSAISLYKRIGRSPGSGAMVSNGLKEMQARGILPLDDDANKAKYPHTMPNTGFYTPFPSGWEATAKQFAGVEAYVVRDRAALLTALCRQEPVVVGRSGHSICYVRPMLKGGRIVVKYANSWGNWGDQGFGYDSENLIRSSSNWAFVLRTVTVRSQLA